MLNEKENNFIKYWEKNREKQKKLTNQLIIGLPTGLLVGLPILLNLFLDWNKQIKIVTRGELNTLLIAVLIIVSFMAIFTVKHKWDLKDQYYRELLIKEKKENF